VTEHRLLIFRKTLRILGVLAMVGYILFLIMENPPLLYDSTFADTSVYLLFLFFLLSSILLWKFELTAGILLIVWYGLQWVLVFKVWTDGALTLVMGLPIACIGILAVVYGIIRRQSGTTDR